MARRSRSQATRARRASSASGGSPPARRARLAQQPHERLRVLPRPVLADRDVAVDDAHRRVVRGEVGQQPRGVDAGARRPAAEAVGLERRVRRGRHPAVAAHVVPDVRRAAARHRLDDAAAVAHDDVGVEHQRRRVVRRLGERAADGELEPELLARRGEHRPPLRRQVVAERQHLQRALADGHARREDVEVDGLGQAVERQRERLCAEAAGHPLVEGDRPRRRRPRPAAGAGRRARSSARGRAAGRRAAARRAGARRSRPARGSRPPRRAARGGRRRSSPRPATRRGRRRPRWRAASRRARAAAGATPRSAGRSRCRRRRAARSWRGSGATRR